MNAQQILIEIANKIIPLESELECHIFIDYSPHVNWVDLKIHPNKWKDSGVDYCFTKKIVVGDDHDFYEISKEISSEILRHKTNENIYLKFRLDEIIKEKKQIEERLLIY